MNKLNDPRKTKHVKNAGAYNDLGIPIIIYAIFLDGGEIPSYIGRTSDLDSQRRNHLSRIKYIESLYGDLKLSQIPIRFDTLETVRGNERADERKAYWIRFYNEQGTTLANYRPISGGKTMNRGVEHGNAKLKSCDVRAIRASEETAVQLSKRFGVSKSTIHRIIQRVTWRGIK